jgi:hypothetical protein
MTGGSGRDGERASGKEWTCAQSDVQRVGSYRVFVLRTSNTWVGIMEISTIALD